MTTLTGHMGHHVQRDAKKVAALTLAYLAGMSLVSTSVLASLNATAFNTTATQVVTDTLKLELAPSGVSGLTAGLTTAITHMAPGDVQYRFMDLSNTGTMSGRNLRLSLTDAAATVLTTDATAGLQVTIAECSVAWTTVTGLCSGGAGTSVLASTSAATLAASASTLAVVSLSASSVSHLRVTITLPAGSEVTENGLLPSGTVQGLTSQITWLFTEDQRVSTTTAS